MRYVVVGRVQPERANVRFDQIEMKFQDGGTVVASCDASQITIRLDVPSVDGWIAAKIVADDVAHIIVGSLGFSLGSGYSVELVQVIEEDGTPHVFGVRPEGEQPGDTLRVDPQVPAFNRARRLSGRDVFFRLAVRDYLRAITDVADCATYCYRAIEGIKSAFVFKTGRDRWDDMHEILGTRQDVIETTVKQYADAVRHGNWIDAKRTDKFERWKMLALTREILIKYLDYAEPAA